MSGILDTLLTVVSFLVVLAVLILAHELGHFGTAKAAGIKVEEFGLGFPPRILSVKRGETVYSLNAIPLGGFTKMAGEEDPAVPRSLSGKSVPTRLLVLSAGSLMNLLLPLLLFSIAFMVPHNVVTGQVTINKVLPDSPAATAGIRAGDVVLSIDGQPVRNSGDLLRHVQLNLGKETTVLVRHSDGTTETARLTPRWRPPAGQGAIGVSVGLSNPTIIRTSEPPLRAVSLGVTECVQTFLLFKNGIVGMVIGTAPVEVTGPVGIAQLTGEAARAGIGPLLEFAAFLSINLGIINIFPLPALDGGRIVFVLLEWVRRGKRISPRVEGLVHFIGFALLMSAILLVTYHDLVRIMQGGTLP